MQREKRPRGAGFVWISCLALVAYLGTAVASGNRERAWESLILPEDRAEVSSGSFRTLGRASWYGPHFDGQPTANGETFDMNALTAAHRTLPLGSRVLVHNLENDRRVVVRINDRGPYIQGRDIDLSYGAARQLGMVPDGLARVEITPL
ncbi:MAG TPA: septal ring lytic transglycosylase RlpA family protein [Thermoanaerobaculia bacterium]|jgi:rare lipoprotein A